MCLCSICDFFWPERYMYFSDVCFTQEEHTDSGLSDTATDGVRKFFVQDGFLERKLSSVIAACLGKLAVKCVLVNTSAYFLFTNSMACGNVQYLPP